MADIKLKDGRTVTVCVDELSVGEWRQLISKDSTREFEDSIVAKCLGITAADIVDQLSQRGFNQAIRDILDLVRKPIDDPNSPSASAGQLPASLP